MNAVIKPVGFDHHVDGSISEGDITLAGLEAINNNVNRQRADDLARNVLMSAAGVTQLPVRDLEKQARRQKLLSFAIKVLEPERLYQQLCAGVAQRSVEANTALWLAQNVANQVVDMAAREYVRRKREQGVTAGFNLEKDDSGVWCGFEATNIPENARDNRENSNIFSKVDTPESVEAVYNAWYESIEIPLLALAGASTDRTGGAMLAGQRSRWIDTVNGLEQLIETFEDRAQFFLELSNDRDVGASSELADNAWSSFN